jgi:ribosomal protein S18 acetylase RimI-like enzyme
VFTEAFGDTRALQLDAAVQVREGRREDAAALATLHAESWQLAYRGIIPDRQLRALLLPHDYRWWRQRLNSTTSTLVLTVDGVVAGYATYGRARHKTGAGEIYELYLGPSYQGMGLGMQLFESVRERLDRAGMNGLVVWVLAENTPAITFYRKQGGRVVKRIVDRFATVNLAKWAFLWP